MKACLCFSIYNRLVYSALPHVFPSTLDISSLNHCPEIEAVPDLPDTICHETKTQTNNPIFLSSSFSTQGLKNMFPKRPTPALSSLYGEL